MGHHEWPSHIAAALTRWRLTATIPPLCFLSRLYADSPSPSLSYAVCCAALTIAFVRGFSLNFGVYYAVRESLNIPFRWNPIVLFITR